MASPRGPRPRRKVRSAPVRLKPAAPHPLLPIGLLLLATIGIYWNGLHGPFVWDDQTAIVSNETIRQLWPIWQPLSPPGETPVAGRPVVNLSFAINYAIGGFDPTGYHAWNLAVHLGCVLLLFAIVRRTLIDRGSAGSASNTALLAALLWAVHPLATETVDYATERSESMMAFFVLATLYCAIRARDGARRGRWEAAAIVSCALGMATKESAVVAPLIVLLYDRTFTFTSLAEAVRRRKRLYGGLLLTWLELAALIWWAERSTVSVRGTIGPWTYLLNQAQMIARYLQLTVWPRALVLDYGLPLPLSIGDVVPQALLVLTMLVATLLAFARWPPVGFLGVMFFLTLAPTSSIVPILSEVGAERRMYLPLAALSVLAVVLGRSLVDRLGASLSGHQRTIGMAAAAITIFVTTALAVRTVYRNAEYGAPLALWRTVVERRPHGRARMAYATELVTAGRHDEALSQLKQAVSDFPDARYAFGTELVAAGHLEEGVAELQQFIRAAPGRSDRIPARLLLGHALTAQGKLNEGADQFRALLEDNPANERARQGLSDVAQAHVEAARAALDHRASEDAVSHARLALDLDPGIAEAHNLLGVVLASKGQLNDAIVEFRRALENKPDDQQARNNLAHALELSRGGVR